MTKNLKTEPKQMRRAAISVVLGVCFGAFLSRSIVAVITQGDVVAAVACMSASLVGSFAMLICYLARAPPQGNPTPNTCAPRYNITPTRHARIVFFLSSLFFFFKNKVLSNVQKNISALVPIRHELRSNFQ